MRIKQVSRWSEAASMTQAVPGVPSRVPAEGRLPRQRAAGTRWLGVGNAAATDPGAGRRAAAAALQGRSDARLLVVFASSEIDVPAVVADVAAAAPDVPLVGCTTAGEIATSGPSDRGVVVVALGGDGFTVRTTLARHAGRDLRRAGAVAAESVDHLVHGLDHRALMLLTDGLAGDQQEIVRGAYGVVGAEVPLVGGCAGDDLRMETTSVIFGTEVLEDGVVGVAIGSTGPIGIGVRHGWRRVGDAMLVTRSDGGHVYTLDDEPALDVYLRVLDAPPSAHTDPAEFTRFAMTHPLGLNRRLGEEVRFIAGADFERRSLTCIAAVPQGGVAFTMEGDDDSVLAATDAACEDALAQLGGAAPLGMLAFDCIARRGVLGDAGISREVHRIGAAAPGTPVAGFYTYGEIARTRGVGGFHNQTLVVLALG